MGEGPQASQLAVSAPWAADMLERGEVEPVDPGDVLERLVGDYDPRLRKVERDFAEHDGEIKARWSQQEIDNARNIRDHADILTHLQALDRRVWMAIGAMAVLTPIGAIIGTVIAGVFFNNGNGG